MNWLTLAKYGIPLLLLFGILTYAYTFGYERAATKYKAEIATNAAALATATTKAKEANDAIESQMVQHRSEREALAASLAQSQHDYADLGVRLAAAIHSHAVPRPSPGNGPAAPVTSGDSCVERISERVQSLVNACQGDADALTVLGSRPVCECK